MKQILGDNQFFGINHNDLEKGNKTKEQFSSKEAIIEFINKSISIGLDGYMINSNEIGFKIPTSFQLPASKEIHNSVPYPHKYASMVNENGMLSLLKYIFKQSSLSSLFLKSPKFLFTRNIKDILPIIIDLEIPAKLPKNSYVYLQNIVTDLVLGLKREDLLLEFCNAVQKKGYKPGLITLNPTRLDVAIQKFPIKVQKDLVVCFNINVTGFNVFPSRETVEKFVKTKHNYKKMGMSILSSGGAHNIEDSIQYIKTLNLDYVVYGSSNLKNIEANYKALKS
jgi:hypothetical protein